MGNFLFLTSTNLASNPRLLKELKLVLQSGHTATVIEFKVGNWSDGMTDILRQNLKGADFIELSAMNKPLVPWMLSSLLQKACSLLPVSLMNSWMLSMSAGKRTLLLLHQLKKMDIKFDWVIAHNPSAFYPAYWYAKKINASLGIDVEDYHPGETNDVRASNVIKKLMQAVLPFATYCSYAAPLIAAEVQQDIPGMKNRQLTILNGFEGAEFHQPTDHGRIGLQMVWFSQNIDAGRGLEHLIPVVNELYPAIELHLIGNLKPDFANQCLQNKTGIFIHAPMPQDKLHAFLSKCDIGLATDIPVNRNREIALTNKIIAYAQAGLFILAFDTEAQRDFLSTNELQHQIAENNHEAIRKAMMDIDKNEIRNRKDQRFENGKIFYWHHLSKPLLEVWSERL